MVWQELEVPGQLCHLLSQILSVQSPHPSSQLGNELENKYKHLHFGRITLYLGGCFYISDQMACEAFVLQCNNENYYA